MYSFQNFLFGFLVLHGWVDTVLKIRTAALQPCPFFHMLNDSGGRQEWDLNYRELVAYTPEEWRQTEYWPRLEELNKKLCIAFMKAYNTNPDTMDFTIMMCIHAMRTVRQYSLDMSLKPKFVNNEATPEIKWNAAGSLAKVYRKPTKTQAKKGRLDRPEAAAAGIKPSYPARKRRC